MTENDVEACHRLRGDKTIVKICKRQISQNVLLKKKSLKKVKPSGVCLSRVTALFINESLYSYYKGGINAKNCGTKNLDILTSLSMAMSSML